MPLARGYEWQNSGIWDSASAERAFASGSAWFGTGPSWMMNALPGSHFHARYTDRSGDTQESTAAEAPYVGTLHDVFDVNLFNNVTTFGAASGSKTSTPALATLQTYTYNRTTSNTSDAPDQWSAGTNWTGGIAPVSATDTTLTFGAGPLSAGLTVFTNNDIGGNFRLNILNFSYAGPASGVQPIVTISGNPLEFVSNGGVLPTISVTASGTIQPLLAISNNLVLTNNLSITGTSDAIVSGTISGAGSLTKSDGGKLTLTGGNTYSGGTTVSAGLLELKSSTALGSSSGSLTVNGGILDLNGQTISVGNLTGSGGTIWNNGPNSGSGTTVTLTIGNGDTGGGTYAGLIRDNNPSSDAGKVALTKTGTGTITLSGANDYTGTTTVSGGALFINGNQSAATGAVTVNGSGTTLGGSGTIGGSVTVSTGSSSNNNLSPGGTGVGSVAKLNTGALTLNTGTNLNIDITGGGGTGNAGITYDQVSVTGTVNLGGPLASNLVLTVSGLTQSNVGDKFVIVLNDGMTDLVSGAFAQGLIVTASNGDIFAINYVGGDGNDIELTLSAIPEPSTWIGAALALGVIGVTQRKRFVKRLRVIG